MYQGDCESSRPFLTKLLAQNWFFVTKVSIESGSLRRTAAKALSWGNLLFWTDCTADPTEDSGSLGRSAAKALSWGGFSFWTDRSADPTDGMGKRVIWVLSFTPFSKSGLRDRGSMGLVLPGRCWCPLEGYFFGCKGVEWTRGACKSFNESVIEVEEF